MEALLAKLNPASNNHFVLLLSLKNHYCEPKINGRPGPGDILLLHNANIGSFNF